MANVGKITRLPHIRNTQAGNRYYDPAHNSIYEVAFSIPAALSGSFTSEDVAILSEQVIKISGLDALQKMPTVNKQKFYGATSSSLSPTIDDTSAEISIEFNLNIRNTNDAYVLRLFKAWQKLNYDLATGARRLMKDYIADFMNINVANRDGTIWRQVKFQKVILTSITGLDDLDYSNNEPVKITCKFVSDLWDDDLKKGIALNN